MILTTHIIGAACTGILVLFSIIAIRIKSRHLSRLRLGIIATGLIQIVSGTLLVVSMPEVSVGRICIASMLYIGVVVGVEAALRKAIKVGVTTSVRN